jgi:hypothetical protein
VTVSPRWTVIVYGARNRIVSPGTPPSAAPTWIVTFPPWLARAFPPGTAAVTAINPAARIKDARFRKRGSLRILNWTGRLSHP